MEQELKAQPELLKMDWNLIFSYGALIAMFPIEEWLEQFRHADTIAPILDPTLYRDYLYSAKGDLIQDVLRGALAFKQAIVKAQEQIKADPKLGEPHPKYVGR